MTNRGGVQPGRTQSTGGITMTGPIKAGSVPDIGLYGYPRVVALGCSDSPARGLCCIGP